VTAATALNDLLRIGDLSAVELERGSVACFLEDPATRQHLAVATAAQRLGLLPVMLTRGEVEGLRADPTGDTPRVVAAYAAGPLVLEQAANRLPSGQAALLELLR
jgi:ornithine carbamoyltransferase